MQLRKYQIITITIFLIIACTLSSFIFAGIVVQVAASSANSPLSISVKPGLITPTPFQPGEFAYQLGEGFIEELPQPAETPTPVPTIDAETKPKSQVNILLLGSDYRPENGYRTDVIMLLSLNPQYNSVSVISFPRDLFVQIPGWQMNRINTAHQVGGFEMLADTFEVNFGIRPDHYVMVDFKGFAQIINSLGGIDVYAEYNLSDTCATWINASGQCSAGPGWVHLNGDLALWYARARHSTSDFDRTRRAQEIVQATFNRLISLDAITRVPELYAIYSQYVQTDIGLGDILPLLPLANIVSDGSNIHRYAIGPNETYNWITPQGAMVLVPLYDQIHLILVEAMHLDQ